MKSSNDRNEISIIEVPAFTSVSIRSFSATPVQEVMKIVRQDFGRIVDEGRRIIGFDYPDPCGPSQKHGYEIRIEVTPKEVRQFEAKFPDLEYPGGTYAVSSIEDGDNQAATSNIGEWIKKSGYSLGIHQGFIEYDKDLMGIRVYQEISRQNYPEGPIRMTLPEMQVAKTSFPGPQEALQWYHSFVNINSKQELGELQIFQAPLQPAPGYEIWIRMPFDSLLQLDNHRIESFNGGEYVKFKTCAQRLPGDIGYCPKLMDENKLKYGKGQFLIEPFRHLPDLTCNHAVNLYYPVEI